MADGGKVTVEVDVVVRSVRLTTQSRELPTAVELSRALAVVDGWDWCQLSPATRASYLTRANELRYVLGGDIPTCPATAEALGLGGEPPLLACSLNAGHPGWHTTEDGCQFAPRGQS